MSDGMGWGGFSILNVKSNCFSFLILFYIKNLYAIFSVSAFVAFTEVCQF